MVGSDERDEAREATADDGTGADRLLVCGLGDGGRTAHVLRRRGDTLETGRLAPIESGKPLTGEIVKLSQRPELPLLFDVDVQVPSPLRSPRRQQSHGPSRVSSDAYRRGWDAIWGRREDADGEDPLPN